MKTETRQRIEVYKNHLPKMKERIMGAALMLLMAVVMTASVTFAWVTLSNRPEVKGMNTTLSANGTLEIALVQGDGSEYPTSGRGDSSAVDNNVARSNVTWGNLVNLSDESYGLQYITLRPSLLNRNRLKDSPLQGAVYSWDGRVQTLDSDYTFAKWDGHEFLASKEKGVRSIAAYKLAVSESTSLAVKEQISRASQKVSKAINDVDNQYKNKAVTSGNLRGLQDVLSSYVSGAAQDKLNGTSGTAANTDITSSLGKIYNLYNEFYNAMVLETVALKELANFQRYLDSLSTGNDYTELTWEGIKANKAKYNTSSVNAVSTDGVVSITGLTQFISDMNQATIDLAALKDMYEDSRDNGTTYIYSDISTIIYRLAGTDKATVNGKTMNNIGTSDALGMLSNPEVQLTAGFLRNFEQLAVPIGSRISVYMDIPINGISGLYAMVIGSGIKNAHLTTNASGSSYTEANFSTASNASIDLVPGDKIATDNYGLAVDFWVRTNAKETYLILDGHLESEVQEVRVKGTDGSGLSVDLYTVRVTKDDVTTTVDVYQRDGKWYYDKSNEEVTGMAGTPIEKYKEEITYTGYSGSNRVWDEENKPLITSDSTTQGNGSCYIFYADSPEEQAKFLKLLSAFHVAFVSQSGQLLAEAKLDTENYFAVNGKITVPLVITDPVVITRMVESLDENGEPELDADGEPIMIEETTVLTGDDGEPIYAIMPMERNVPTMLTAIIYLDGSLLGNDDVLAASSIQGQLNFQFTSTTPLNPISDSALEAAERTITASVDKTSFDFAEDDDLTVHVTVSIDGDDPANVSAFFQRAINSTQGKRMEVMRFVSSGDGSWTSEYQFYAPGEYYLREVMLDGVSYMLHNPLHVTVSGFAPDFVGWGEGDDEAVIFTASSSYQEPVYISFGMDDSITRTSSVRAVFFNEKTGNSVNFALSYDPVRSYWTGIATFGTSGVYELKYVVVNGEYYDLGEYNTAFVKKLTLNLGLHAVVTTTDAQRDFFVANTVFPKNMTVRIYDNSDNEMKELVGAVLTYSRGSSSTDTVNAPLTWEAGKNAYTGTLSITKPGSYSFLDVTVGDNRVTRASEYPTFLLRNPDPVSYNTASISTFHGEDNVQFVPVMNNAYMGPIKINNSDTAYISAIVHNSITNEDYTITQSTDTMKNGTMYYDSGSWYINLPTYRLEQDDGSFGPVSQDGVWTLVSISLWDVIDVAEQEHTVSNKLVWTDGQNGYDFSSLSTVVSSSINVTMTVSNSVNLGDQNTPFMTSHPIAGETGMSITIVDNEGRAIPKNKISNILLNLSYTDNQDRSYGYKVSGYTRKPSIGFNLTDESGTWSVSEDFVAQYVGQYYVRNLTVTLSTNDTVVLEPEENGVPALITIRSAGPESNVKYTVKQRTTVFGKDGSDVTGYFLQAFDPGITVTAKVTYEDEAGVERFAQYAVIDDLAVSLNLTYQNGKSAPNGGYSWTGTSPLELITMQLNAGENTSNGIPYTTGSTNLLAGTYSISGSVMVNGTTIPLAYDFANITAYSMSPTVKVTNVNPANGQEIQIFQPSTSAGDYTDYIWNEENLVTVKNFYNNFFANVYMYVVEGNGCPDYTSPRVTLSLSNIGNQFTTASVSIPNASSTSNGGAATFSFTPSSYDSTQSIGYVESKTEVLASGSCDDSEVTYEKPVFAGTQSANMISVVRDSVTFTVTLTDTITIRETNETPPSISFQKTTGYVLPEAQISEDGQEFTYVLPANINTVSKTETIANDNAEWTETGTATTQKLTYVSKTTDKTRKTTGCNAKTYYYAEHVYQKYTRTTTTYTATTSTETDQVVYGVIGWTINGVHYAPGDSVTVSGQVTAVPEIGELSRTVLSSATKTGTRTMVIDVFDGSETINGNEVESNAAAARTQYNRPSGYNWGNTSNPQDGSWVNTTGTVTETWQ